MGKMKRWQRTVCMISAITLMAAFGFMGIEKFAPQERSLKIVDEAAIQTSRQTETGNDTSGNQNSDENSNADSGNGEALDIEAKAAILIDGNSGKVLYAQNEKKHLPPASVTKVMTLLLVLESCESGKISLDDKVTISERAASMGGSQMYMEPGEQHTVKELLKGVIMVSANDGCVALAEHVSGSVEEFVDEMNKKAKSMELNDSNFVNTNGLPVADHYSCAYDIGMISAELMKYEEAREWFTAWQEDIKVGLPGKESKFTLTNTNKLIKRYNGAIGVKTGFTEDAGYCLSGAAERDGTRLIGVVLGCETSDIRFGEMSRILDYGFARYETVKLADKGEKIRKINIEKGDCTKLYAVAAESVGMTIVKKSGSDVKKEISIENNIRLPIKKGDKVGSICIEIDGDKAEYDLVSDRDVNKADYKTTYIRMIKKLI